MGFLNSVKTGRDIKPIRALIYSEPKMGKTTLLASVPGLVMLPLEEGKGVLEYPELPIPADWEELISMIREIAAGKHEYRALGIDCLSGVEEMLHRKICAKSYGDDWTKFNNFGKGVREAGAYWVELCRELDRVRASGVSVWCAAHSKLDTVDDVEAGSYSRITPAIDKHALKVVQAWADLIGHIDVKRRAIEKGEEDRRTTITARTSGGRRLITQDNGSHMAGNRYGLESPIELPADDPYGQLKAALKKATSAAKANEPNENEKEEAA